MKKIVKSDAKCGNAEIGNKYDCHSTIIRESQFGMSADRLKENKVKMKKNIQN